MVVGRIRGTLKREPLLNPVLSLLNRDLIQRVYIPKGPPDPTPYHEPCHYILGPQSPYLGSPLRAKYSSFFGTWTLLTPKPQHPSTLKPGGVRAQGF